MIKILSKIYARRANQKRLTKGHNKSSHLREKGLTRSSLKMGTPEKTLKPKTYLLSIFSSDFDKCLQNFTHLFCSHPLFRIHHKESLHCSEEYWDVNLDLLPHWRWIGFFCRFFRLNQAVTYK